MIRIYRCNQLLQTLKLGFFYLMFHKPQHGFHKWHGKCPAGIQPRPMCYEASMVSHC